MLKTFEGFYRDGKVELAAVSDPTIESTQVLVTFFDPQKVNAQELKCHLEQLQPIQEIVQFDNHAAARDLMQLLESTDGIS
jgi:hypothetical protein